MAKRNRIPRDGAPPPPRDNANPAAHQVVSAGDGGGFGVTSRDGGLESQWFDSRGAAEAFAKAQRKFFEGLDRAAEAAAAKAGVGGGGSAAPGPGPSFPASMAAALTRSAGRGPVIPPPPAAGAWPAGMGPAPASWFPGGMYPQGPSFGPAIPIGPGGFPIGMAGGYQPPPVPAPPAPSPSPAMFPASMFGAAGVAAPAGPVAPPSPFPASMFAAMAPGPRAAAPPTPAGAWPAGMGPAAAAQWPSGMTPGATPFGPPLPPGPGGFPSSMNGGYQPPQPTPPNLRDIFRDLGKDLLAAIKDGQPGKFDWVKIGEALGKGIDKAGPIATAAGIPLPEAVKLGMAATKAMGDRLGDVSRLVQSGYLAGQEAASINAGNRHLAGYNGNIAGAFGELNFGDFRRTYELAQATAGTTATLARSVNAMKDAWQPYEVLKADVGNRWGVFQAARSEALGNAASLPLDAANWVLQHVDPDAKTSTWAGKGAAYLQAGGMGAVMGFARGGPWGALAGGAAGIAYTAGADWFKGPAKPATDPWGDFLKDASNVKPLRPAREVKAF